MPMLAENNKRIMKNTLLLYIRMGITMLVSLYTSRIVLKALGVDDFGIYSIVCSVIVAFSFISSPLSSATQRFYNFELGRINKERWNMLFIHVFLFLLDGTHTEFLEYEDENYVYYVRAIPKYSVARTDKKVTTITKAGDGETSEEDSFLDDDQSLDDYFRT